MPTLKLDAVSTPLPLLPGGGGGGGWPGGGGGWRPPPVLPRVGYPKVPESGARSEVVSPVSPVVETKKSNAVEPPKSDLLMLNVAVPDRKSTRLNSSHMSISY